VVHAAIRLVAFDILVAILDGSDTQHNEERQYHETRRNGRKLGEELQDGNEGKEAAA